MAIAPPTILPPQGQATSRVPQVPPAQAGRNIVIPLPLGGEYTAGDPSSIPDNQTVLLHNLLIRPNRVESRPPAVYDNLMSVIGVAQWEDMVNEQTRFCAVDRLNIYLKGATGETWGSPIAVVGISYISARVTDWTNYLGRLWLATDNGLGVPNALYSFDGTNFTNVTTNTKGAIWGRAIASYGDRLFIAYPVFDILLLLGNTETTNIESYDWTTRWTATHVKANILTGNSGQLTCRLAPDNTTPVVSPPTPCTATIAAGAGVDAGLHSYKVTFVTPVGETPAGTVSNQVTTAGGNLQVNLTAIPIGPPYVIGRRIYRTVAGDTGLYYFQQLLPDNITTTATDNMPDANLLSTIAIPTLDTSAPLCSIIRTTTAGIYIPQGDTGDLITWEFASRGVDELADVPITLEMVIYQPRANSFNYPLGSVITATGVDGRNYRYRATSGGVSTSYTVPLTTVIGALNTDGSVIWLNEGTDVLAALEMSVINITDAPKPTFSYLTAVTPVSTLSYFLLPRVKFYNSTSPNLTTLAQIDISYRDGLADTDPRKANWGSMWTVGSMQFPFFNKETSTTVSAQVALQSVIWSEIGDADTWRGINNYNVPEEAGFPTALKVVGGRLMMFKRRGMWQFYLTSDPDNPILPEVPPRIGVGCISPRAIDTMDDEVFWLGEYEVYRLKVGYEPRVLAGVAMREAIFNRGAGWVESQATYNMPLLAVDRKNREVWAYTQKGKLYCYHLGDEATPSVFRPYVPEMGMWTEHDIDGQEVQSMAWNPTTQELIISIGGGGLVRLDPSKNQKDQIDNTANTYTVSKDVIWKPIETFSPRYDSVLEGVGVYHVATASQASQTLTLNISLDRGATYPYNNVVQFDPTVARIPIAAWECGPSITLKLSHSGSAGPAVWGLSKAEAILQIKRGEWPQVYPTAISHTL